jgi:hypothetical protein
VVPLSVPYEQSLRPDTPAATTGAPTGDDGKAGADEDEDGTLSEPEDEGAEDAAVVAKPAGKAGRGATLSLGSEVRRCAAARGPAHCENTIALREQGVLSRLVSTCYTAAHLIHFFVADKHELRAVMVR